MPDEVHLLDDDELSEAAAAAPAAAGAAGRREAVVAAVLARPLLHLRRRAALAGASVLVQYIYNNLHFSEPFTLTYLCTPRFSVYLPFWATPSACDW